MKKIIFVLSIILLTGAGNLSFAQQSDQKVPKKPKKIRVSDIVTYGLPEGLNLSPSRPLPADFPCPPTVTEPKEVLEDRFIVFMHNKPQIFLLKTGLESGSRLDTYFLTSEGEEQRETFLLSSETRFLHLRPSEEFYGLIHFCYQDRNGNIRFIDFYIP